MIRFVSMDIDSYMGIKLATITPAGNLVQLTGKNGQGKTACIQALKAALFGKRAIPHDPVHHGADEARIRLDLGEIVIRLVVQPDGESQLVIESEKGARFPAPQAMLKKLIKHAGIDPSEFLRMSEKEQLNELAKIVGLGEMLNEMSAAHQVDYENRAVHNRKAKELQAQVDAIQWDGKPVEAVDVAGVMAEIRAAEPHNTAVTQALNSQGRLAQRAEDARRESERNEAEAERLLNQADALRADAERFDIERAAIVVGEPIDTAPLQQKILDAQPINDRARKIEERQRLSAMMQREQEESDALTRRMKDRESEKAAVISATEMPVAGLGFGEHGIMYEGVPLANASTAEQGVVACGIYMSANPDLRLIAIGDGSLYDANSLAKIEKMAKGRDYIVLSEHVRDDDTVGIVISDGEVVKNNYEVAA